jgi:hypothetical protein
VSVAIGLGIVAVLAGLGIIGYRALFSVLSPQDDDGYLTVSLALFTDGSSLYDDVYSQYGPGLYALLGGLVHILGVALTTDGARFINLALWLGSAGLACLALLRLTRSVVVAFAGLVLCFLVLDVDANEPLHPGALIGFLLIAMAAAASMFPQRRWPALTLIGALAMSLLTVKVNIGVFAFAAIACASALAAPPVKRLLPLRLLLLLGFVAVPLALMSSRLDSPDTKRLALIATMGALAVVIAGWQLRPATRPDLRDLGWLALGAAGTLAFVVFAVLLTGTSPGNLVDFWFIRPADTPALQFAPLYLGEHTAWWAGAGLACCAALAVATRRGLGVGDRVLPWIAAARIAVGLGMWVALSRAYLALPDELTTALVAAAGFAWVAAVPRRGESAEGGWVRVLLPALAVLQVLHAFPVPGSQIGWSVVLFVIVGGVCIGDGVAELREFDAVRRLRVPLRWVALGAVALFGVYLCAKPLREYSAKVSDAYAAGVSLDLPGAERVRLPADRVAQLHDVVAGIRERCSTFITIPGLNSLYLFSGEPVPAVLSGPWPFFLTDEDQQEIVDRIRDLPSLCVVGKPDQLAFWAGFSGGVLPQRPLVRFINDEFRRAGEYNGYLLAVRRPTTPRPRAARSRHGSGVARGRRRGR